MSALPEDEPISFLKIETCLRLTNNELSQLGQLKGAVAHAPTQNPDQDQERSGRVRVR